VLLGVAPAGQLQPGAAATPAGTGLAGALNHLLVTPSQQWGDELRSTFDLVQLAAGGKPVLYLLIGGDDSAIAEVRQAVKRGWQLLIVRGSGGAADRLARQWDARSAEGDDPAVAEILAEGRWSSITLGDQVAESVEMLTREVLRDSGGESVLAQAWRRFAAIDSAAKKQQQDFDRSQKHILVLGVLTVLVAIGQAVLQARIQAVGASLADWMTTLESVLSVVLISVPILLSAMIAAANRFNYGKRWMLLRAAAESIKREIYRYRLHGASYAVDDRREKTLARRVEGITRRLMRTEVNTTSLPIYRGPIPPKDAAHPRDNGMSRLSTDQYVRLRLRDQLAFYRGKTSKFEKELQWLQRGVLASGALGTLLAVPSFGLSIWVALTTAVTSALVSYLGYRQVESTLTVYNQTATDLENILAWWTSLEPDEQAMAEHIEALSTHTEDALSNELASWTQRMSDALEKLRETQTGEGGADAGAGSAEPPDNTQVVVAASLAAGSSAVVEVAMSAPTHSPDTTDPSADAAPAPGEGAPDSPAASGEIGTNDASPTHRADKPTGQS
jgi:hypothetical protein